jgi:hypothetical protein
MCVPIQTRYLSEEEIKILKHEFDQYVCLSVLLLPSYPAFPPPTDHVFHLGIRLG